MVVASLDLAKGSSPLYIVDPSCIGHSCSFAPTSEISKPLSPEFGLTRPLIWPTAFYDAAESDRWAEIVFSVRWMDSIWEQKGNSNEGQ